MLQEFCPGGRPKERLGQAASVCCVRTHSHSIASSNRAGFRRGNVYVGNRLWDVPVTGPDGSRILSEEVKRMNAQIPDYADISHADIVTRDLKRRRPFQQNGKGYRDTLLWETIVRHYIAANALTLFVTQNVRDFCDTDDSLHKELLRDVRSATKLQFRGTYRPLPINTSSHI